MSVYRKPGSKYFWYDFWFKGHRVQETTKMENRREAENVEKAAWVQLARGEVNIAQPKSERQRIDELLDRLKLRWQLEKKASAQNLSLLKKAKEDFGTKMADELTDQDCERYAMRRQKQGYARATTNRIFQCLRRAFRLAKITWPDYKLPNEKDNVREGFLSAEQMTKLLAALPDDGLRDYVEFCWCTGVRKGESASLRWSFIHDGQIVVPPEFCKARRPHVIPIAGPLVTIIQRRQSVRAFPVKGCGLLMSEFIFHRNGEPIREFRKSWKTACTTAGIGNTRFHDLRRSCVRDLVRAGVPQSVAMKISGHRTVAVFLRYDITAAEDMTQAFEKTAAYRAG